MATFTMLTICEIGYVRSAILHNPLSLKIKLPRVSDAYNSTTEKPDEVVLTSPTYQRVIKYLKTVLEAEFKSEHNLILKGKMAPFVRQFERYVKGQYPFDRQDTLSLESSHKNSRGFCACGNSLPSL
jgi:hypothetical protein